MTDHQKTIDRMASKFINNPNNGCWEWVASKSNGYGRFWYKNKLEYAHRISHFIHIGPIPDGLTIDHLCKNPPCINPKHLEVVTQRVNSIERGTSPPAQNAKKTHCIRGHEFTDENTYLYKHRDKPKRSCKECQHLRYLKRKEIQTKKAIRV